MKNGTKKHLLLMLTIAALVLTAFATIGATRLDGAVCPSGNVKYEVGSGYEYNDGSANVSGDDTTVSWSANPGYTITSVCVKIGGPGGGSLVYPNPSAGSYTTTSYGISHVVVTTTPTHTATNVPPKETDTPTPEGTATATPTKEPDPTPEPGTKTLTPTLKPSDTATATAEGDPTATETLVPGTATPTDDGPEPTVGPTVTGTRRSGGGGNPGPTVTLTPVITCRQLGYALQVYVPQGQENKFVRIVLSNGAVWDAPLFSNLKTGYREVPAGVYVTSVTYEGRSGSLLRTDGQTQPLTASSCETLELVLTFGEQPAGQTVEIVNPTPKPGVPAGGSGGMVPMVIAAILGLFLGIPGIFLVRRILSKNRA